MGIFTKAISIIASGLGLTDQRLYRFVGGGATNSGETVSVSTAMQLDAVWACVRLIAGTISTLPLQLYKSDPDGRGTMARDHPLYPLLHDQPNGEMTAVTFWEATVASILLWGNSYAAISRAGDRIIAITPLMPDRLTIRRQPDGSLIYRYNWYGQTTILQEAEVLHIKGFSLDGLVGISPIAQARETLGVAMAAEKSAGSFFRNGMRPSTVMSSPTYLTDKQRERFDADFEQKFIGSINAGRVPLLEGGWTLEAMSINPDDAQLLATRGFSIEQICRLYGVAPVMVGHMETSTAWGTGLEQMNLWFLTYTLRPLLRSIEQEIKRTLMTPADRLVYYAEFNVEGLQRADSAGRAALMQIMAVNGLATRNELRALDNRPPLPGGDDLTVMVNLIPAQDLGKAAAAATAAASAPAGDPPAPTPSRPRLVASTPPPRR